MIRLRILVSAGSPGAAPHAPQQVQGEGWTGYIFGNGDADYTYYAVAIPCKAQHVMLEIGFVFNDPTIDLQQQRALEYAILAALRFSPVEATTARSLEH